MRILHTADWHLGLRLYKRDLFEEHRYFFQWLIQLIKDREIAAILISGDVFDQSNPSNEARTLYYEFLKALIDIKCKVIITGGNHDSPGVLNAPRDILELLDIHVVGSIPHDINDQLIEIRDSNNKITAVIAAVPYLREPDIYALTRDSEYSDKRDQVREAIRKHYNLVAEACKSYQVPVIAMGHLYAAGSSTSDSERLIQMGNQSAIAADDFSKVFNYVALGHIHRPQYIAGLKHIRYSGSPVPLSFSERSDKKILIELEIRDNQLIQTDHEIPVFRKLQRFRGSYQHVIEQVEAYREKGPAKAFGELQIEEEQMDPGIYGNVARFFADWNSEYLDLVNYNILIKKEQKRLDELSESVSDLKMLQPLDVLNKMMESGGLKAEDQDMMRLAFLELLNMEDEIDDE